MERDDNDKLRLAMRDYHRRSSLDWLRWEQLSDAVKAEFEANVRKGLDSE